METRRKIRDALRVKIAFLFEQLHAVDTQELVSPQIDTPEFRRNVDDFAIRGETSADAELAD